MNKYHLELRPESYNLKIRPKGAQNTSGWHHARNHRRFWDIRLQFTSLQNVICLGLIGKASKFKPVLQSSTMSIYRWMDVSEIDIKYKHNGGIMVGGETL